MQNDVEFKLNQEDGCALWSVVGTSRPHNDKRQNSFKFQLEGRGEKENLDGEKYEEK